MRYPSNQKAKAREAILQAGARTLRTNGFNGIGVDGIAASAGVTSGALYCELFEQGGAAAAGDRGLPRRTLHRSGFAQHPEEAEARVADHVGDRAPGGLGGVLAMNIDAHAHFGDTAHACHSEFCFRQDGCTNHGRFRVMPSYYEGVARRRAINFPQFNFQAAPHARPSCHVHAGH